MSEHPDFGLHREFYSFAPETLGEALPEFEILGEIGKGSMGIVYDARRRADGARIALKVLPPSLTLSERTLARFLREGRLMAKVEHPDIVRFLDQGQGRAGGVRLLWFAMEHVDGITLQERLRIGPLPVRSACAIAARVGRALQYAHERGVVHRDVKPGNIMLRDPGAGDDDATPRISVTDFGLARETGTGSMTESGAIVGTPMYMAPELVLGGSAQAGTLADVYALGATLYTLLTGQPPFEGPTAQSVLKSVLDHEPRRPRRLRTDLPLPVEAIVQKAMAKDPRDRYGSALELSADLERWLAGERVQARPPGPLRRAVRTLRRRPMLASLLALLLLTTVGSLSFLHERHQRQIEQGIAEAEGWLAQAATARDERDQPRTEAQRRELLLAAISAATDVIARDSAVPLAWFVRAKAHHRMQQFDEAIVDLDAAERLLGQPTPEILHFRIDALRQRGDPASTRRLQQDLTDLLALDSGTRTRTMVAEHLLEIGLQAAGLERSEALHTARQVLDPVGGDNARATVLRARLLEADGALDEALAAMRRARRQYEGDVYVHLQAAAMFDRLGLPAEGRAEHETARLLEPAATTPAPAPVDVDGLGAFLGDVNRLLQALDAPPQDRK
ncbi:MAG: protein kinase [Planctomycetota bacterium]